LSAISETISLNYKLQCSRDISRTAHPHNMISVQPCSKTRSKSIVNFAGPPKTSFQWRHQLWGIGTCPLDFQQFHFSLL